jgi:3'-phosphoadenosine 5'-phosphosulfate sulfotransferase (PAPS reductase)/FAD synthetase
MSHFTALVNSAGENVRHVLGLSGGKDSAALAIFIKDQYPEIHKKVEYFFSDTGAELPEAYEFLDKLETYLGKPIVRLGTGREFDHWLTVHNDMLPSARARWCTRTMKIKPFEKFVGDDPVISYVGIRADENREGYISSKDTIKAVFPFIDDGLVRDDIFRMLEDTVGIPEYYKWRSRSGCYFCFFQRQDEWLGLKENHPKLFEKAKQYELRQRERYDLDVADKRLMGTGNYTWSQGGTIEEIAAKALKRREEKGIIASSNDLSSTRWQDILKQQDDDDPEDQACLICSL